MANVSVADTDLVVTIPGWDRVFALKSELRIPLDHVKNVSLDSEEARGWWHGFKGGADIPGVIVAGTFYTHEGKFFYDVHDPDRTITLDLDHGSYDKVIVQVEDPEKVADEIRAALEG